MHTKNVSFSPPSVLIKRAFEVVGRFGMPPCQAHTLSPYLCVHELEMKMFQVLKQSLVFIKKTCYMENAWRGQG